MNATQPETPTATLTPKPFRNHGGNEPGYRDPIAQAIDWQRALNKARDNDPQKCVALAQGARAWIEAERLKREIRMQPKPRPVDVTEFMKRGGSGRSTAPLMLDITESPAPSQTPTPTAQCCKQPSTPEPSTPPKTTAP